MPVPPIPLKAMGRFKHEAIAVDEHTGNIYLTEDAKTAGFYRFVPKRKQHLVKGWGFANVENKRQGGC